MKMMDLEEWLLNPITKELFSELVKYKQSSEEAINNRVYGQSLKDIDLHLLSEFKGHIRVINDILNFEEFFRNKLEKQKEVKDEEI